MYKKKTYFNTIPNAHDSTNKVLPALRYPLQLIIHKVLGINCEKALPFGQMELQQNYTGT